MAVARVSFLAAGASHHQPERIAERLLVAAGGEGRARGWRALWMRIAEGDATFSAGASRAGAEFMGTLVTYRHQLSRVEHDQGEVRNSTVRAATEGDIPALRDIAARAFRGGRYHRDTLVDPARADALWAESAENSVRGRAAAVLVAGEAARVDGFITLHRDHSFDGRPRGGTGVIGLIAVAAEMTGHGLGRALVDAALDWFRRAGVAAVEVGTQANNAGAMRLYATSGFHRHGVHLDYRLAPESADR
jgi:GNAT superfamily N-acetyltransferase